MMNMKKLSLYTPAVNPYEGAFCKIDFFRDEDGRDWYESQKLFSPDTLKISYNSNNVIKQYDYDVSSIIPYGVSVAEVEGFIPEPDTDITDGTWIFDGKNIVKRTYTALEIQERAESRRQNLISSASETISLWQSELLLGVINDEDKASLIQWMAYIKALQVLDFSDIDDETGYDAIVWPEPPGGNDERRTQ